MSYRKLLLGAAAFAAFSVSAAAGTYTWEGANGSWDADVWNDGTTAGRSWQDGNDAVFSGATGYGITINANYAPTNITFNGTGNWQLIDGGNNLGSAGVLTKNGTGMLTLLRNNVFSGAIAVNAGVVMLNGAGGGGGGFWANSFTLNGGRLVTSEGSTVSGEIVIGAAGASFGTKYQDDNGKSLILAGSISGSGAMTIERETDGANDNSWPGGRVILTAANSGYTGAITISGAKSYSYLQVGNGGTTGSLGGATTVTVNNDSKNSNAVIFKRSDTYTVTGGGSAALDGNNTNARITGTGKVDKEGSGRLIMAGTNNYSGGTNIGAGTLQANTATAVGTGVINIYNNASLELNGGSNNGAAPGVSWNNDIAINNGTLFGVAGSNEIAAGKTITITNTATFGTAYQADQGLWLSAKITGSGNVVIDRWNTGYKGAWVVFGANNDYAGTTTINDGGNNPAQGNADIKNQMRLQIGNGGTTGSFGVGDVVVNGELRFKRSDTYVVENNISGKAYTPAEMKDHDANLETPEQMVYGGGGYINVATGTVVFAGENTYKGVTDISTGATLQIGNSGTKGSLGDGTGNVVNNGTLKFNRSDAHTVNNAISGTGAVEIIGGSVTLAGANTYTGNTTIKGGTLCVVGSASTVSAISVESAGTLQLGDGTVGSTGTVSNIDDEIKGTVTGNGVLTCESIDISGTISPGSAGGVLGELTIGGSGETVTISDTGKIIITVADNLNYDKIFAAADGEIYFDSGATVRLEFAAGYEFSGQTDLEIFGGTVGFNDGAEVNIESNIGGEFEWIMDGDLVKGIRITAIPEPSTYALLAGAAMAALAIAARSRRQAT